MRLPLAIAACLGLALTAMTAADPAAAQSANEEGARLLMLNRDDAAAPPDGGLRILRGSAAAPRAAPAPGDYGLLGPGRWQVAAGERFWLFDQETRKLASCRNRGTANVGEREIECTFGTFGRYRRTFGNNWTH